VEEADLFCEIITPDRSRRLPFVVHAGDDPVSQSISSSGSWEVFESELIWKSLVPGDTFVDVGANLGYFSVLAADRVGPSGCVIAFEPEQANFALLQNNIGLNPFSHYHLHNVALSDVEARGHLFLNLANRGDHQIYASTGRMAQAIVMHRADDLLPVDTPIRLIKMDTQGAEHNIIRGMQQTIARNADELLLITEFWPRGLARCGGDAREMLHMLLGLGFKPYVIEHIKHVLLDGTVRDIEDWIDDVETSDGNEGFLNLLFAGPRARLPDVAVLRAPY